MIVTNKEIRAGDEIGRVTGRSANVIYIERGLVYLNLSKSLYVKSRLTGSSSTWKDHRIYFVGFENTAAFQPLATIYDFKLKSK